MTDNNRPYPANNPCPCGSGLKYIDCCLDRAGTKWELDENGQAVKVILMDKETSEMPRQRFEEQKKDGSNPEGLIFPEIAKDLDKFNRTAITAMMTTIETICPILLWIFIREGLLIFDKNIHKMSSDDGLILNNLHRAISHRK